MCFFLLFRTTVFVECIYWFYLLFFQFIFFSHLPFSITYFPYLSSSLL